jgi:hypothetical protein
MAQFMNHHIIGDGMGCLDDVPIENQLPMLIAGATTTLEIAYAHPCWRNADLLGITVRFLLQTFQGTGTIPTMQVLLDPCLPLLTLLAGADGGLKASAHYRPLPLSLAKCAEALC